MGRGGAAVVSELPPRALSGLGALLGDALETAPRDSAALIRSDGTALTYRELSARSRAAPASCAAGAGAGKAIGIAIADPAGFLLAALAAWECGAAVLPLDARTPALASELAARGHAAVVVSERPHSMAR